MISQGPSPHFLLFPRIPSMERFSRPRAFSSSSPPCRWTGGLVGSSQNAPLKSGREEMWWGPHPYALHGNCGRKQNRKGFVLWPFRFAKVEVPALPGYSQTGCQRARQARGMSKTSDSGKRQTGSLQPCNFSCPRWLVVC